MARDAVRVVAVKPPSGLGQMWRTLAGRDDRLGAAITLVFLRQLLDPEMPTLAGNDPRTVLYPTPPWQVIVGDGNRAGWLDALADRLNELLGEPLLIGGWEAAGSDLTRRVVEAISRWQPRALPAGGDLLGDLLERFRSGNAARGAFYTPYNVAYAMALMTDPPPGERVCDPCCGSGRMLLAALQVCRENHAGAIPILVGVDSDPDAVRVCKLNLLLAGYPVPALQQIKTGNGLDPTLLGGR